MPARKKGAVSAALTPPTKRKHAEVASIEGKREVSRTSKRCKRVSKNSDESRGCKRKAAEQDASEPEFESETASSPSPRKKPRTSKQPRTSTRKTPKKDGRAVKASFSKQNNFNNENETPVNVSDDQKEVAQSSVSPPVATAATKRSRRSSTQQKKNLRATPIAPEALDWMAMIKEVGIDGFNKHIIAIRRNPVPTPPRELRKWEKTFLKALIDGKSNTTPKTTPVTPRTRPLTMEERDEKNYLKSRMADIKEASRVSGKEAPVVLKSHIDIARDPFMPDYRNLGDFKKPLHHLAFTRTLRLGKMAYGVPADFHMTRSLDISGKGYKRQPMPKPDSSKVFRFTSWEEGDDDVELTEDLLNLPQEHVSTARPVKHSPVVGTSEPEAEAE